jgi:hypothetical protein
MSSIRYIIVAVSVLLLVACATAPKNGPEEVTPITAGPRQTGPMSAEKGDVNGDGKPDVWNYYKEVADPNDATSTTKILVKKEADLNFDNKKDIVREFDDDGVLLREEADLDYDGNIDQVNLYDNGILTEKQLFRGKAGAVFIWKFFKDGKLARLHRDDTGDGKADYCELWYAGEKLSKKGWDKTGNGECDYWENAE